MSTRHRWADVIAAWANGETIQWSTDQNETWRDWPADNHGCTPHFGSSYSEWRVKPRMCSLNGHEFPAPRTEPPHDSAVVWMADPAGKELGMGLHWTEDTPRLMRWLRHGRIHDTRVAAIAHARAEILAVGGTLEDES